MKVIVETEVIAKASLVFEIEEDQVDSFISTLSSGITPLQMLKSESFQEQEEVKIQQLHRDRNCVTVTSRNGRVLWNSGTTYVL